MCTGLTLKNTYYVHTHPHSDSHPHTLADTHTGTHRLTSLPHTQALTHTGTHRFTPSHTDSHPSHTRRHTHRYTGTETHKYSFNFCCYLEADRGALKASLSHYTVHGVCNSNTVAPSLSLYHNSSVRETVTFKLMHM